MEKSEFSILRKITVPIRQYVNDGFEITRNFEKMPTDKEIDEWNKKIDVLVKKMYMSMFEQGLRNEAEANLGREPFEKEFAEKNDVSINSSIAGAGIKREVNPAKPGSIKKSNSQPF